MTVQKSLDVTSLAKIRTDSRILSFTKEARGDKNNETGKYLSVFRKRSKHGFEKAL